MRHFMRPVMAVLLAVGALALAPIGNLALAAEPTVVDGMAAVVNGDVITYSQVRALCAPEERMLRQQYTGPDLEKKLTELRQLALKDLIDRRLIIQAIKIDDYYRKHRDEFTSKEQIKLRMIMIAGHKDTASAPAQKELAEEVLGKLAGGAEFEQMAQMYSEDSTKDNGGDWGWIERKTLAEPLEKFAFNMPVGRISNIIDYAGNYYILKVEDKHGGSTKSLAEVRGDIEKKLVQDEAQQIQERWLASLREKAYIKTY